MTTAQGVGFGVVAPTRAGKDNPGYIVYGGETLGTGSLTDVVMGTVVWDGVSYTYTPLNKKFREADSCESASVLIRLRWEENQV